MTYRQYQAVPAVTWDALREIPNTPWTFPETRKAWLAHCAERFFEEGCELAECLRRHGITSIVSAGCGTARLEYWLTQYGIDVTATDSSQVTVNGLQRLDPPFGVKHWDFQREPGATESPLLIFRCDTELSDVEWAATFARLHAKTIIFIPDHCGSLIDRLRQFKKRMLGYPQIGWLRTKPAMRKLWATHYTDEAIQCGEYQGWILRKR